MFLPPILIPAFNTSSPAFLLLLLLFFFFICGGFCHTLKWNSHGFTYVPHPDPPSHLPLHPLPLGFPSVPGPSACLMHPTCSPAFLMMRSYRLNKQGDSRQPCHTPFSMLFPCSFEAISCSIQGSNCCFLNHLQVSQETGKMVWYSQLSKSFPQFAIIHTVKRFGVLDETEIDVFLELSCFLYNPVKC